MPTLKFSQEMWNLIYPVGSIYLSAINTNPASYFGGTWVQIKSRYLYATGLDENTGAATGKDNMSTYTGANTQSHTLTANQSGLREHNHGASGSYSGANFYIRHGATSGTQSVEGGWNTWIDNNAGSWWSNGFSTSSYGHNIDRVNIGGTVGVSVNNNGPWNAA